MSKLRILICEDNKDDQMDIKLYLDELDSVFTNLEIETTIKDFNSVIDELKREYNLLILDFFDGDEQKGERILNHNRLNIPTTIYTARAEYEQVDYNSLKKRHSFLINYLPKLKDGDNLKDFVKSFAFSKGLLTKNYSLYNENDIFLHNSIISIGQNQFDEIIYQLSTKISMNGNFVIHRMTSGLSGAALFKIEYDGKYSILKLSREIDKLKTEHENAISLYHKFPNRLINHINYEDYNSFDKSVLGILLKDVNDSDTFFDFLLKETTKFEDISNFLENIFLSNQGLKTHYASNQKEELKDWTHIFKKFNQSKFSLVELAVKELSPLLTKYFEKFNVSDIKNAVLNNCYKSLDKSKLLDKCYQKPLVLNHGDFHSKNILVQNDNLPVIIDTGAISYGYWCVDICRLIVNIFIVGIDFNKTDYFDINNFDKYLKISNQIISRETIELDSVNDNVITSLNWLLINSESIYGDLFNVFEFQLGLMKEFLQIAYRVDTIPPNKRVLALASAYNCMLEAEKNCIS